MVRRRACWAPDVMLVGESCQKKCQGQCMIGSELPISFIQDNQLMSTLRKCHFFLRKALDTVAHNVNACFKLLISYLTGRSFQATIQHQN